VHDAEVQIVTTATEVEVEGVVDITVAMTGGNFLMLFARIGGLTLF
jgi:hypothetical protein